MTRQPRTIVALSISTAALLVPAIVSKWNSDFGGVLAGSAALIQRSISVENETFWLVQLTLILIAALFVGITGVGLGIGALICRERSWGWAVAGIVVNTSASLFVILVLALGGG